MLSTLSTLKHPVIKKLNKKAELRTSER